MADEYGADDDDPSFFYDDDDYLYVEDDYAIADELAETQIPSPGYSGAHDELALDALDYDVYEYFGDLEYGGDSYWDARIRHLGCAPAQQKQGQGQGQGQARAGEKRKSEEGGEAGSARKRRREEGQENVVYVPFEARCAPEPPGVGEGRGFALLPDWKERFPEGGEGVDGAVGRQMPADMRRAAEGEGEEEDEEGGEMEEDGESEGEGVAGVDHDVVMHILRQKLADSGLGDVDEGVFEEAIANMLSGKGDGDDALGGLANILLGQKGEGGEAFQGFLAGQGVQLDEGEDGDGSPAAETSSENKDKSTPTQTSASSNTTSNPSSNTPASTSKRKPTGGTEPPPASTRKRRAPSLDVTPVEPANATPKPSAKRRKAPTHAGAETPQSDAAPATSGARATRDAAAGAKGKR